VDLFAVGKDTAVDTTYIGARISQLSY
jgi:hypothetical protein